MSAEQLRQAIKRIAKQATPAPEDLADLLFGVVRSVSPMKIEVENKYAIEDAQILLSPFCYRKEVRIGETDVELWPGLAVGDRVVMLRHSDGQAFYVLQRAGELG
jgi:hypothetical protein